MMHINTHEAFKQLVEAGVKEKAAETIIRVIDEARKSDIDRLATKEDLKDAKAELKQDIHGLEIKINNIRTELKEEISDLKGKFGTMQWMMGFLLAMSSAILLKLFLGN